MTTWFELSQILLQSGKKIRPKRALWISPYHKLTFIVEVWDKTNIDKIAYGKHSK